MSKISIITPVKNNVRYIEACIQSVLRQVNHEHIIMDGCSTDGTLSIIKKYQQEYPDRIKFISEADKSAGEAWVKGMKVASGDFLSVLGADDTLEPNAVKTVLDFFSVNQNAAFVFGGCNRIDADGNLIGRIITKEFDINDALNNYCSIPATSAFYRREVIEKVNPSVIAQNDGELEYWLMVGKQYKIWRIPQVLSNFRLYHDKGRRDGFYTYASTVWKISRRQGARLLSPCARRYYLALVTYPLRPILDPVFLAITKQS